MGNFSPFDTYNSFLCAQIYKCKVQNVLYFNYILNILSTSYYEFVVGIVM